MCVHVWCDWRQVRSGLGPQGYMMVDSPGMIDSPGPIPLPTLWAAKFPQPLVTGTVHPAGQGLGLNVFGSGDDENDPLRHAPPHPPPVHRTFSAHCSIALTQTVSPTTLALVCRLAGGMY